MSILLHHSNTIILMVPKCGSKWVRYAVDFADLSHFDFEPDINGGHHALTMLGNSFSFSKSIAIIREPISWYHSYWSYRQRVGWGTAEIDRFARSDSFVKYMELALLKCPQYVTRLYGEFLGKDLQEVDFVGDLRILNKFLGEVLYQLGEVESSEIFSDLPKLNQSHAEYSLPDTLKKQVLRDEKVVYEKFSNKLAWKT